MAWSRDHREPQLRVQELLEFPLLKIPAVVSYPNNTLPGENNQVVIAFVRPHFT